MKRNSVFAVAREAMRQHSGWGRTWGNPEAKKTYDVVIIGAGGHGLATAYYLGKNFGITNVASRSVRIFTKSSRVAPPPTWMLKARSSATVVSH